MLSSWAKYDLRSLDFALGLACPDSVRRPAFIPAEGIVYLLPKAQNGEIVVATCLRKEDVERLRTDGKWLQYAEYM
ncbi:hypothetical protein LTR85_005482 [Meristemomyces frigidus]|nr:hypothetical protein LTR85_005482 [Meristemomyces frigidus]